jgi:DNA primase
LDHLLASGLAVRVAVVPAPHDPDSYLKANGGAAFRQLIEKADGFFDYYLKRLCATHEVSTDKGRLAILGGMAEAVHKTGNVVLIDKYAQKTALRLGVGADAVRVEFKKAGRPRTSFADVPEETVDESSGQPPPPRPSVHESWLLKLLFLHEEFAGWIAANLDPEWVQHPLVRQIVVQRLQAHQSGSWQNMGTFLDQCEMPEIQNLITEAATEQRPIPNPAQQLADVTQRLRSQSLERQLQTLLQRANQPEMEPAARVALLRQQQEIRALKSRPISPPG